MIRRARFEDLYAVAKMAQLLWPEHTYEEMEEEFSEYLRQTSIGIFLAGNEENPVGFALCQLRHDYVEGTESSPVGYLEGIFVREGCRRQGYARALLAACENWAREQGCREFASDCELDNEDSLRFHMGVGFTEANRIICFTKKIVV